MLIPIIIVLLLISSIGLPGNVLVCYFYGVKSTSRWFIFFLGCANFVQCLIIVPGEVITAFFQYNFTNNTWCKTIAYFNCVSLAVTVYMLAIVAINRYRKVCRPHGWQIKFRTAKILTGVTVAAAFLFSVPTFWLYGVKSYVLTGHNITVITCGFSEGASNSPLAFYFVLFGMILTTACLATICILYCFIRRGMKQQLQKEQKRRQQSTRTNSHDVPERASRRSLLEVFRLRTLGKESNKGDNSEMEHQRAEQSTKTCIGEEESTSQLQSSKSMMRNTTFSLFLISLAFILSYLPTLLLLLIRSINSEFEANLTDTERGVIKFFIRLCWLNCALNPFLLALSDSEFRTHCKDIVSQGWKRLTCKT